jgi:hypothetical protein
VRLGAHGGKDEGGIMNYEGGSPVIGRGSGRIVIVIRGRPEKHRDLSNGASRMVQGCGNRIGTRRAAVKGRYVSSKFRVQSVKGKI